MKPTTEMERLIATARKRYDDAGFAEYLRGAVDMNGALQLRLL